MMVRNGLLPGGTHFGGRSFGIFAFAAAAAAAEGRSSHRLGRIFGRRSPDWDSGSSTPDTRRSVAGSSLESQHCRTDLRRATVAIERVSDASCSVALASSLG